MTLIVRYVDDTVSIVHRLDLEIAERMAVAIFDQDDDVKSVMILDQNGDIKVSLEKD